MPSTVVATNTGIVFVQIGDPPGNVTTSSQYDEALVPGASAKRSLNDGDSPILVQSAVWFRADNAGQILIVKEIVGTAEGV